MKFVPRKVPSVKQKKVSYSITREGIEYDTIEQSHNSVINKKDIINSINDLWCKVSKREKDLQSISLEKLDSSLSDWKNAPEHQIETLVRSAVYLAPRFDDSDDIDRLISVFESPQSRKEASNKMNDLTIQPYYYDDSTTMQEKIEIVMNKLDLDDFNSLSDKDQSSLAALSLLNSEDVDHMIDIAVNSFPDKVMPSDVVMVGKDIKSLYPATSDDNVFRYKVNRKSKDKNYIAGRDEEDNLFSDSMEADIDASAMILEGYSEEDIIAFHNDVPKGYWKDVLVKVSEGHDDLNEVYDLLDKKYRWHPEDRRKPDLF